MNHALFGSLIALSVMACSTDENDPDGSKNKKDETPTEVVGASLAEELRTAVKTEWGGVSDTAKATDETNGADIPLSLMKDCTTTQGDEFDADVDGALTDIEREMDKILDLVVGNILQDQFIESEDGSTVVFLLDATSYCEGDEWCLDDLNDNPVRASAIKTKDGTYVVEVLVGKEKTRLATLRLSDELMDVTADLADFLTFLQRTVDADEAADLPSQLEGKVSIRLQRNGVGHFTTTIGLTEALALAVDSDDGPVNIELAKAEDAAHLSLDANTDTVEAGINLGAVNLKTPGTALCGSQTITVDDFGDPTGLPTLVEESTSCGAKEENGRLTWHLAGASASVVSSPNTADSWTVEGIGVGDDTSYFNINDERLAGYDLNADNGRKMSITITEDADSTIVSFEPALNMTLAMQLNRLSDELKMEMPQWLMDEVFDVTFGGAAKKSIRIAKAESCGGSGAEQVEVSAGNLFMNASSLTSPINAEPGMCLEEVDTESEHPFEWIAAGVCQ